MNWFTHGCRAVGEELCGLGRHTGVVVAAPTQHPELHTDFKEPTISEKLDDTTQVIIEDHKEQELLIGTSYKAVQRDNWAGRFFDWVVGLAGTRIMFTIIFLILLGWAIAGIVLNAPDTWQVILQDASSIQVRKAVHSRRAAKEALVAHLAFAPPFHPTSSCRRARFLPLSSHLSRRFRPLPLSTRAVLRQ